MKFIKTPYLPENNVSLMLAGRGAAVFEKSLLSRGVSLFYTKENPFVSSPEASHADLACAYLGNGKFLLDKEQKEIFKVLCSYGGKCKYIAEDIKGEYPKDCALNFVVGNGFVICNAAAASKALIDFSKKNGMKIINVKQGYTKCSVCPVCDNAFITDDESVFKALKKENADVLLVEKGSVRLPGYNFGFIGGCCGKISKNEIAFCGDIKAHKNYDDIKAFAANYGISLVSLSGGELLDVGSLIPITEKEIRK